MNFENILSKLKTIEENGAMASTADTMLTGELEECGDMGPPESRQSDSVTMNVSMNGSGKGGIRDLMDILNRIEGGQQGSDDVVFGIGEQGNEMQIADEFGNEPTPQTAPVAAVTPTGDDLASKGAEAEKVNGGGNPMGVDESLVAKLANLYQEVKSR